jgi:hypothetical protein
MAQSTTVETDDSCKDLKTIQYKTQILKGDRNPQKYIATVSSADVEAILERERTIVRSVTWARLERSTCISKLREFATVFGLENEMTLDEKTSLAEYLIIAYERKRLERARDVSFDKDTQNITDIPCLTFNKSSRKFTLSRSERRVSSSAALGPGRETRRKKQQKSKKKNDKVPDINTLHELK